MSDTFTKMYLVSEADYKKLGKKSLPPVALRKKKVPSSLPVDQTMVIKGMQRARAKNKYKRPAPFKLKRYR